MFCNFGQEMTDDAILKAARDWYKAYSVMQEMIELDGIEPNAVTARFWYYRLAEQTARDALLLVLSND